MEMLISNHFLSKDWGNHPIEKNLTNWLLKATGEYVTLDILSVRKSGLSKR